MSETKRLFIFRFFPVAVVLTGVFVFAEHYNVFLYIRNAYNGLQSPGHDEYYQPVTCHIPTGSSSAALLVHGQNQRPKTLEPILAFYHDHSISTCLVALTGHRGHGPESDKVSRKQYLVDVETGYRVLKENFPNGPITGWGYSHGALLLVDLLNSRHDIELQNLILMAPALATRYSGWLVRLAGRLLGNFHYPSGIPTEYRANAFMTLKPAVALFDSLESVREPNVKSLNLPTQVIVDPEDELLHVPEIEGYIRRHSLTNWTVTKVSAEKSQVKGKPHHLIIGEKAVGSAEWERILLLHRKFLPKTEGQ